MTDAATRLESLYAMRDFIAREIAHAEVTATLDDGGPLAHILASVADLYSVDPDAIIEGSRSFRVSRARQGIAWLLYRRGMSMREIGRALGWSDHHPAVYACRKVEADAATRALLRGLEVAG
jgi:chromosomal replication initiation ATPase DnaA